MPKGRARGQSFGASVIAVFQQRLEAVQSGLPTGAHPLPILRAGQLLLVEGDDRIVASGDDGYLER